MRFLLSLFFCLSSGSAFAATSLTGHDSNGFLNLRVQRACVSSFLRNISPGPYALSLRVFRNSFHPNTKEFRRNQVSAVEGGLWKFSDFETNEGVESSSTIARVKATMGLPMPTATFDFKNFEIKIPMAAIENALYELPPYHRKPVLRTPFIEYDDLMVIAGLEIRVVDLSTGAAPLRARVAFADPDPTIADSITEDFDTADPALFRMWPQMAVLLHSYRDFLVQSNEHTKPENSSCKNSSLLSFDVTVKPPSAPSSEGVDEGPHRQSSVRH